MCVWFVTIATNEQGDDDDVDRVTDGVSAVSIETTQPESSASVATDNYPLSNDRDLHGDEEEEDNDDDADDSGLTNNFLIYFHFL